MCVSRLTHVTRDVTEQFRNIRVFTSFSCANFGFSPFLGTAKAQIIEGELISNHREEVSQLKKLLGQKEDDLHRTVQKYEQVLQVLMEEGLFFSKNKTPLYISAMEKRLPSPPFGSYQCLQLLMKRWFLLADVM